MSEWDNITANWEGVEHKCSRNEIHIVAECGLVSSISLCFPIRISQTIRTEKSSPVELWLNLSELYAVKFRRYCLERRNWQIKSVKTKTKLYGKKFKFLFRYNLNAYLRNIVLISKNSAQLKKLVPKIDYMIPSKSVAVSVCVPWVDIDYELPFVFAFWFWV